MKYKNVRIGQRFKMDVNGYYEECLKLFNSVKVVRTGKVVDSPDLDAEVDSVKS